MSPLPVDNKLTLTVDPFKNKIHGRIRMSENIRNLALPTQNGPSDEGMLPNMAIAWAPPVLGADQEDGDLENVYEGTIQGEPATWKDPVTEFYRLPLKQKNEIVVSVKASSNAEIVLYDGPDGDTSSVFNLSDVKVQIVLGCKKNTAVSIGLDNHDRSGKYPKEIVEMKKILSATHPKVFTIRWYCGRVMVYHHGFKKPFIIWDGPKHAAFNHIRVRTPGCSGEWKVQNEATFITAASKEYTDILINSGRLDFEVNGSRDAWIHFFAESKFVAKPCLTVQLGWHQPPYQISGFWENLSKGSNDTRTDEGKPALLQGSYRRFYVEWDAMNMVLGHGDADRDGHGHDTPFAWRRNMETNVKPIKYFGLQCDKSQSFCYFHILNRVLEEDTAPNGVGKPAGHFWIPNANPDNLNSLN